MGTTVLVDPDFDKGVGYVKSNPMADFDAAYTWDGTNTYLTQVVITGLGKTKTITYSWTGARLDSMAVTIT